MSLLPKVRTAEVVDVAGKKRLSTSAFNNNAVLDHLMATPKWLTIEDLARLVYGRSHEENRRRIRNRLPGLRKFAIETHGILLVSEYHGNSRSRIKILDPSSAVDRDCAERDLERRRQRNEVSEEMYEKELALIDANEITQPAGAT